MIQLLLSQLLLRVAKLSAADRQSYSQSANLYVRKATEFIHQHYDQPIQVNDIATAINLHPGYLHRIFRAQMNCTIMEYLTSLRIKKAKMLLTKTDIPVIHISDYIGLNSSQYFSTIFKKQTGKSPLEYRKSLQIEKR